MAINNSSCWSQLSTSMLAMCPKKWRNPSHSLHRKFLIGASARANLGLPLEKPSVLSLNQCMVEATVTLVG